MAGPKVLATIGSFVITTATVSTAIAIASTAYQIYSANKMKRKMAAAAEARKGFEVPVRGTIDYIPVVYGKQIVGGIEVAHKTSNGYPGGTGGTAFEEGFSSGAQSGSKNEFMGVQTALCHEGIEGIVDIDVNESRYNFKKAKFQHRFHTYTSGGTADAASTSFGFPSTNKFTDCAWATAFYKLNRDEQNYSGIPSSQFLMKGQKLKSVVRSGSAGSYSYALSSGTTFSNNPAYCLLDYLLDLKYGRGLSTSEVDLSSFYHAAQICATPVLTDAIVGGRVNGVKSFQEYSSLSQFPNITSGTTAPQTDADNGLELAQYMYKATDTGLFYLWNNDSYSLTTANTRTLPLYECNVTLDTAASIRENIETLMATMGLAELTWSSEGKYKLLLEYPTTEAETFALVNSAHHFTEDTIIRDSLGVNWPPANDRFNQVTINFSNEHEDFKNDSVTWPPTGSSAHSTYLAEDNQQPFTSDISGIGMTDPYHALAKAEQTVRQSREMKTISVTLGKAAANLEPGDFISIFAPNAAVGSVVDGVNVPEVFRLQSIRVQGDMTIKVEAYCFKHTMLAWNVEDTIAYVSPPEFDFTLPDVTNVVSTSGQYTTEDGTSVPFLDITWDSTGAYQYEILYKKQSEADSEFRSILTRLTKYRIEPVEKNVNYYVKVRAASATGLTGGFGVVTPVHTGTTVVSTAPTDLSAEGGLGLIKLSWTNSADTDLKATEIWEGPTLTLNDASKLAETSGDFFVRSNLGPAVRKYYWIRAVSRSGKFSTYLGPETALTTLIGAADIAASTIPYTALATSVTGVITAIDDDITNFRNGFTGDITTLTLADMTALTADVANNYTNTSTLTSDYYTATAADSAISTAITNFNTNTITANYTNTADLETSYYTKTGADSAIAAEVSALGVTVGQNYATITSVSNIVSDLDDVEARYGVEINVNNKITGIQLTGGSATTNSGFNVQADQFNVSSGSTDYPVFSVRTSAEVIGGTTFPAGGYFTGYLSADRIVATTSIASPFADIGTVVAGTVSSAAGNMVMDLDSGTIIVRDASNNIRVKIGNI